MDGRNKEIGVIEKSVAQVTLSSSDDRSHHSTNESIAKEKGSGYIKNRRKPSQNDKTVAWNEKDCSKIKAQSPKIPKSEGITEVYCSSNREPESEEYCFWKHFLSKS
ncbi:hypothetical protein Tco_0417410 [Tanacetum coccineum]